MRTIRIYQPGVYQVGQLVNLSQEAAQHIAVVLRMQVGEGFTLFCGNNKEYAVRIVAVQKKQVQVCIETVEEITRESPLKVHLAQAVSKGERMEFVFQKSVELGVTSITPVLTERCVVKLDKARLAKKMHQWQSIVIAACEQSGRNTIPRVLDPMPFTYYIKNINAEFKFILHPYGGSKLSDYSLNCTKIALMVGPEGGFSEEEVQKALQLNFLPLSLGPRILRTETAAISALSILQALQGDL